MPGLHIDEVGGGSSNNYIESNYQDLKNMVVNNLIVPGQQYLLTDYLHKYFIEGSNSSGKVTYQKIASYAYGYAILNNGGYFYGFAPNQEVIVTALPEGYAGAIKVGDVTRVTANSQNYYYQFANGMHSIVALEFKFYSTRYTTIPQDSEILDANGKPVMIPGGLVNTDVHDGEAYMEMTAAENKAPRIERIIITGRTANSFELEAKSVTYDGDELEFYFLSNEIKNDNQEVIGERNGFVYRRKNDYWKIDLPVDWRVQRYRRWLLTEDSRRQLLNQHLDVNTTRLGYEGKWLFTASSRKVSEPQFFFLAKTPEGTMLNLDGNAMTKSFSYTIENPAIAKDFPVFPLDKDLMPVRVNSCKAKTFLNTVFLNYAGEQNFPVEVEMKVLSGNTFVSNPVIPIIDGNFLNNIYLEAVVVDTGSSIRVENTVVLSFQQFIYTTNINMLSCVLGTMQKGVRINTGTTPIPVVWWLYIYARDSYLLETAISGVTPQLYLESTKITMSSFFFYYSPQFNDYDSKYQREVIKITNGLYSKVGLRMFGNLERVELQSLYFEDSNLKVANGLFLYDISQSLYCRTIKKNDATQALFFEELDAEYNRSINELDQFKQNPIDLSLAIVADNEVPVMGENIVFTLTAKNHGANLATNVLATSLLPDGYTFVVDDANGSYDPITGEWAIGELAAGATIILTLTASVNEAGSYTVNTTITATEEETNPADNAASITPIPVPVA